MVTTVEPVRKWKVQRRGKNNWYLYCVWQYNNFAVGLKSNFGATQTSEGGVQHSRPNKQQQCDCLPRHQHTSCNCFVQLIKKKKTIRHWNKREFSWPLTSERPPFMNTLAHPHAWMPKTEKYGNMEIKKTGGGWGRALELEGSGRVKEFILVGSFGRI